MSHSTESHATPLPAMDSVKLPGDADLRRRHFLGAAVGLIGVAGIGFLADILVDNMNPGKAVAAMGAR